MVNFVYPAVEVWSMQSFVTEVESYIFYEHAENDLSDHLGAVWDPLDREVERDLNAKEKRRGVGHCSDDKYVEER